MHSSASIHHGSRITLDIKQRCRRSQSFIRLASRSSKNIAETINILELAKKQAKKHNSRGFVGDHPPNY